MKRKMQSFVIDYDAFNRKTLTVESSAICIDIEHGTITDMFMDLYSLFSSFCKEKKLSNVMITNIEEVEYEGEEEPWME